MRAFVLVLSASWLFSAIPAGAATEPKIPTVFVKQIESEPLFDRLNYPARVRSDVDAQVLSEFDGVIRTVSTVLGQKVRQGKILFRIENTDPIYRYAAAKIPAPIAGVVASIDITVGSRVIKGQKLASITDPNRLRIVAEVPSADLTALTPGMKGKLVLPSSKAEFEVELAGKSPAVDPATGTATAEMKPVASNLKLALSPGTIGRVAFHAREHSGIQVPEHAVVYRGATPYVRTVVEGKAKYLKVELGDLRNGSVEVLGGLSPKMDLIVRSSSYVADGETVKPEKLEAQKDKKDARGEG